MNCYSGDEERLTGDASPAGDVAGLVVGQQEAGLRKTGGHDGVREGDGGLQLDQGDVVAGEGKQNYVCLSNVI